MMNECPSEEIGKKFEYMENEIFKSIHCSEKNKPKAKSILKTFQAVFKRKWNASNRGHQRFMSKKVNKEWLEGLISFPKEVSKSGRPQKSFAESSGRSKRRKTAHLRNQHSSEELTYAAHVSQKMSGNAAAAKIIKEATISPSRANKMQKVIKKSIPPSLKKSPMEALGIFVNANLSRAQYNIIRESSKDIYPCYSLIQQAKKMCYPKEEFIDVTETKAEVKLQALLDHTIVRLSMYLDDILEVFSEAERNNLQLISKWGCDGSNQTQYNQKFQHAESNDKYIFQSSIVPIRLICNLAGQSKIVWQNPTPSSPRFCRPIRIRFVKETKAITKEEIEYIELQIKNLNGTKLTKSYGTIEVKHIAILTMVDGKVCNAATDTSSTMKCFICEETSKTFNDLKPESNVKVENLRFGLSILHARIRLFETLLQIAYKLPIKKWRKRLTDEEKKICSDRRAEILKRFKNEMGLLVDMPKAGFGNTNTGKTSRVFFQNPAMSANITGIDERLIYKLKIILEAISSGFKINTDKFKNYAMETGKLYKDLYEWYPMSPTMHKIFVHGATIIDHALFSIGQLSEEAAEARNKHLRNCREHFSQKCSRIKCNRDVLNRLLLTSDPLLSSLRPKAAKNSKPFEKEVLDMLMPEDVSYISQSKHDDEESNNDSDDCNYDSD